MRALHLERQLKEQHFQANYRGVELEALYDVGLAIASTLDLDRLSEEMLLRAVSLLDARRGALYLLEDGCYRLDRTFGGDARPSFAGRRPRHRRASSPATAPVRTTSSPAPATCSASRSSPTAVAAGCCWSATRRAAAASVPSRTATAGRWRCSPTRRRSPSRTPRLHRQALEKERLEREMELAAEIQRQILPKGAPALPGYDLAGWNRPARQVGGDYYDSCR